MDNPILFKTIQELFTYAELNYGWDEQKVRAFFKAQGVTTFRPYNVKTGEGDGFGYAQLIREGWMAEQMARDPLMKTCPICNEPIEYVEQAKWMIKGHKRWKCPTTGHFVEWCLKEDGFIAWEKERKEECVT